MRGEQAAQVRGVGADWVATEWEQGVYDLYMEYKVQLPPGVALLLELSPRLLLAGM